MKNNKKPLISVVITSYNRPTLIGRAVESVSEQDYERLEIVVVDDCSDNPGIIESEVQKYRHGRDISMIKHSSNEGLAAARNTGIKNSKGDLVSFIDDDDEWGHTKLSKQVRLMKEKKFENEVVYCGAKKLRENSEKKITEIKPKMNGTIKQNIEKGCFHTISSSNLIKRGQVLSIGGFDENLESHIDYDIWMKMAKYGFSTDYVDECLVNIYEGQDQMTRRYRQRVSSTKKFVNKWRPFLREVMGSRKSEEFIRHLSVSVVSRQSAVAITSGDLFYGIKCLFYLYSENLIKTSNIKKSINAFLSSLKQTILSKKS
jgi:glycosyltransferase involved in cell wall biosynthesis